MITTRGEFRLAEFILSLPRPDPCGPDHLTNGERPVAVQDSQCNCIDYLAALSHRYATTRVETGQEQS